MPTLWRTAAHNICPAQRVKQGANYHISTAGETLLGVAEQVRTTSKSL
jgi:hypothetical protein